MEQYKNSKFEKFAAASLVVLSIIGILDAGYLMFVHYGRQELICPASGGGCNLVLASVYSSVGRVPLALIGVLYYGLLLGLALTYGVWKNPTVLKQFLFVNGAGVLVSLYLFYVQAVEIKSFCMYCLGSLAITTLLFLAALFLMFRESASSKRKVGVI